MSSSISIPRSHRWVTHFFRTCSPGAQRPLPWPCNEPASRWPVLEQYSLKSPSINSKRNYSATVGKDDQTLMPFATSNESIKASMFETIREVSKADLNRILALTDDIWSEEEQKHKDKNGHHRSRGGNSVGHTAQTISAKRETRTRYHRPLRQRVEDELTRRQKEYSATGRADRRLRLDRRKKYWKDRLRQQPHDSHDRNDNRSNAEGLGILMSGKANESGVGACVFDAEEDEGKELYGDNSEDIVSQNERNESVTNGTETQRGYKHFLSFHEREKIPSTVNASKPKLKEEGSGVPFGSSDDLLPSEAALDGQPLDEIYGSTADRMSDLDGTSSIPYSKRGDKAELRGGVLNQALLDLAGNLDQDSSEESVGGDVWKDSQPTASSLLDLLNENYFVEGDEGEFGTCLRPEINSYLSEDRSQGSLVDLLNDGFCSKIAVSNLPSDSFEEGSESLRSDSFREGSEKAEADRAGEIREETSSESSLHLTVEGRGRNNKLLVENEVRPFNSSLSSECKKDTDETDRTAIKNLEPKSGLLLNLLEGDNSSATKANCLGGGYCYQEPSDDSYFDGLLSLHLAITQKEWRVLTDDAGENPLGLDSDAVESEETFGDTDANIVNETGKSQRDPVDASILVESLLQGASNHQWSVSTSQLNELLLHLATLEPTLDNMALVIKIFKFMDDQGLQGYVGSAPNAATYSILMAAFSKRGMDPHAAAFVCRRMMVHMEETSASTNDIANEELKKDAFLVDEQALDIGMRILKRCNDVGGAERLLSLALGEAGAGVNVRGSVFNNVLAIYKEENMQKEACDLLDVCIRENGASDTRGVDRFVSNLIRWPRKNRRGDRIATAAHAQNVLEQLESHCEADGSNKDPLIIDAFNQDIYRPSWRVWRLLLSALSHAAEKEGGNYDTVRRSCRSLVHSSSDSSHPDHFVLSRGLDSAEALGDARLAADLIQWSWHSAQSFVHSSESKDNFEQNGLGLGSELSPSEPFLTEGWKEGSELFTNESDLISLVDFTKGEGECSDKAIGGSSIREESSWNLSEHADGPPRDYMHIPVQAYYRALKIALGTGEVELARGILDCGCNSIDSRVPASSQTHFHTLVMAGFAKEGDLEAAKGMMQDMQRNESSPKPSEHTYAAYIHALASQNKVEEASQVLDDMLSGAYRDGVIPKSSCFTACMVAALKAKQYDKMLLINQRMIDAGIAPNPTSHYGVVIASTRLGDKTEALRAAEAALQSRLPISPEGYVLLHSVLLPENVGTGSVNDIRKNLRALGIQQKSLAADANRLVRALRMASIESGRPEKRKDAHKCQELWAAALSNLCQLCRAVDRV